jgi:hypothetical protein
MSGDEGPRAITDLAHERDSDGELLPIEKTVQVRDEGEATLEVYPATSGQRSEWNQRLQDQPDELNDEVQEELFNEFLPYDPSDFGGAESWTDIRPALEDAIANAIFSVLFDSDDFLNQVQEAIEERSGNSTAT